NIRKDITMTVSADQTSPATPATLLPRAVSDSPRRPESFPANKPTPLTPPKPAAPPRATQTPKPVGQIGNLSYTIAEPTPSYAADDMPPPPDNFPPNWDMEWQPSFDEAALASRREPKVSRDASRISTYTPPQTPVLEPEIPLEDTGPVAPVQPQPVAQIADLHNEEPPAPRPTSLYIPLADPADRDHPPQQITILLRPSADNEVDKRRIKALYGQLISFHGKDRFTFHIFENGKGHLIDFPNDTTRLCPELLARLKKVLGEESWRIEPILLQ
ncbi:MAG: hypothetical protein AB1750_10250, partial [Chloroflexota bacterium]